MPSKTSAPAPQRTVDPWAWQPSAADPPTPGYTFEVLDPRATKELDDPTLPGAIGYSVLSCAIRIDFSALSASHELDFQADEVRSVFNENARAITPCYVSSRRDASANLVKITLDVAPSGQVTRANASARDTTLAGCVADVSKKSSFPRHRGEGVATITYEIRFKDPRPGACPD